MRKITVIDTKVSKNEGKIRVAAYCRVSTNRVEQQHSFEAQQRYFQLHYGNLEKAELVKIYTDTNSGTSTAYRPGFQNLIADCRTGKIDRIVTKSLSRFARNTKECLMVLRELKKIGVTVFFEQEGIDTARVSDEIMITIMEGLAQEEAASISRNIRWSLKRKMENGTLGIARVPFGYKKVDGQLEIDEERAKIIRQIFAWYLSGAGAKKISVLLNSEQIPSPTQGKWNNVTVLKILRQEKYIGDIRWQKTYSTFMGEKWKINHGEQDSYYIRDCLPPIISREDFHAAQELRERNTRQPRQTTSSLFRGKTKCVCGRSFYLKNSAKPIWECTGKYDQSKPCSCPVFLDTAYHAAWERTCEKLKLFSNEIILPCIELFEQLEDKFTSEELTHLEERKKELSMRKYVLCSLCCEGYITTEKLISLKDEIDSELEKEEKKLTFLEKQRNESIEELVLLNKSLSGASPDKLSQTILKQAVSDGLTIEFELLGGLKFTEVLS